MIKYHKNLGFPVSLLLPPEIKVNLRYSKHALSRLDRLKPKQRVWAALPETLIIKKQNIVELTTSNVGRLKTLKIRKQYTKKQNIIYVLQFSPTRSFKTKVITFWIQDKKDKKRINKSKFTRA